MRIHSRSPLTNRVVCDCLDHRGSGSGRSLTTGPRCLSLAIDDCSVCPPRTPPISLGHRVGRVPRMCPASPARRGKDLANQGTPKTDLPLASRNIWSSPGLVESAHLNRASGGLGVVDSLAFGRWVYPDSVVAGLMVVGRVEVLDITLASPIWVRQHLRARSCVLSSLIRLKARLVRASEVGRK